VAIISKSLKTHVQVERERTNLASSSKTNALRKVVAPRKRPKGGERERKNEAEGKVERENVQRWHYMFHTVFVDMYREIKKSHNLFLTHVLFVNK
jgi:hypothetical protein